MVLIALWTQMKTKCSLTKAVLKSLGFLTNHLAYICWLEKILKCFEDYYVLHVFRHRVLCFLWSRVILFKRNIYK